MSTDLDQYLSKQPIYIFKLITKETIIAKVVRNSDVEEGIVYVSQPHTLELGRGKNTQEVIIYEWLYGCNVHELPIDTMNILVMHEADLKMKNFYSKCILQTKLHNMALDLNLDDLNSDEPPQSFKDMISSFIEGLEPKDSTEDEDILKPWRNRMQWSPKSDSPNKSDDTEYPF